VVLVHGRAFSPEHMYEHVVCPLDRPDLAFVAPAAPDATWYPKSFLAPLADNQPWLDHSLERMESLREDLSRHGVPPERVVWLGWSQGACVVSQYLSLNPLRWGGLVALTGGLIGPPGSTWTIDGSFDSMPAYFSNSEADDFVPEARTRETAECFAAAGAKVSFEVLLGRGHEIAPLEVERARCMLSSLPAAATT
jgi:phospholipase/carboxylesterase